MRYPYLVYMAVADADVARARAIAERELGEAGSGWFSVPLVGPGGSTYWGACSAVSAHRLEWLVQSSGDVPSFRALALDAESGIAQVPLGDGLSGLVRHEASFEEFLAGVGLARAAE